MPLWNAALMCRALAAWRGRPIFSYFVRHFSKKNIKATYGVANFWCFFNDYLLPCLYYCKRPHFRHSLFLWGASGRQIQEKQLRKLEGLVYFWTVGPFWKLGFRKGFATKPTRGQTLGKLAMDWKININRMNDNENCIRTHPVNVSMLMIKGVPCQEVLKS